MSSRKYNSGKTAFPYWMKGSLICDICKVGYTVLIMKQNNKQVCHNCDTNKKFTYDPIKEKKEKEAKNHEK